MTSEETIFTAYYHNRMVSMDIDSIVNKRLGEKERQSLADLPAMVFNIIAKYYK